MVLFPPFSLFSNYRYYRYNMQHFSGYNPATLGAMGAMYSMHQQAMQMHPGYRPSTHALSLAERLAGKYVSMHAPHCVMLSAYKQVFYGIHVM